MQAAETTLPPRSPPTASLTLQSPPMSTAVVLALIATLIALVAAYFIVSAKPTPEETGPTEEEKAAAAAAAAAEAAAAKKRLRNRKKTQARSKAFTNNGQASKKSKKKRNAPTPKHARFVNFVKGHTAAVSNFSISPDGQFIAVACSDRSLRLTRLSGVLQKNSSPLFIAAKTGFRTISACTWAPTSAGLIVLGVDEDASISLYKCKRSDTESKASGAKYELKELKKRQFQADLEELPKLIAMDQAGREPNIVVAAGEKKLTIKVFSKDGTTLSALRPKATGLQASQSCVAVSIDCRFVAVAIGGTAALIHEVDKSSKLTRDSIMSAHGAHTKPLTGLAFGGRALAVRHSDVDRLVTTSRDGTWALWNIDVEYQFNVEPKLLYQSEVLCDTGLDHISISADGSRVAVAAGNSVWLFALSGGGINAAGEIQLLDTLSGVHVSPVTGLEFMPDQQILAVACADCKVIYMWNAA